MEKKTEELEKLNNNYKKVSSTLEKQKVSNI